MNILLKRYRHRSWGIDGELFIQGEKVADTVEHPTACLAPGTYPVTLDRLLLCRGNGPMQNLHGEICVGRYNCPGSVLRTRETYQQLYNRIRKSLLRGHDVHLTVLTDNRPSGKHP